MHLAELGWKRSSFFGKIPALLPLVLSLTIARNSKRSKLDAEMAKALLVPTWLNAGCSPKITSTAKAKTELDERLLDLVRLGDWVAAFAFLFQSMNYAKQLAVRQHFE